MFTIYRNELVAECDSHSYQH